MKENRKSRSKLWFIVAILIVAAAVAAGVFYLTKRPQWRVAKGLMNLSSELVQYRNPVLEEAGLEAILEEWQEGDIHTVMDMDVTFSEKQESTLGVTLDKSVDRQNKLMQAEGNFRILGKELVQMEVAMDGQELYLTFPALSEKSFKADTDVLKESFNSSILAKLTGWEIPEGYLEFIFGEMTEDGQGNGSIADSQDGSGSEDNPQNTLQAAGALFAGALSLGNVGGEAEWNEVQDFLQEIEIVDTEKKVIIENSWKNIDWDGCEIRMSADMVNELLGRIGQMMGMDSIPEGQEIALEVYLDENDRIMRIATAQPLTDQENRREIEFVLDLLGEERTVDIMSMAVYLAEPIQGEKAREAEMEFRFEGLPGADGCSVEVSAKWQPVGGSTSWQEDVFWSEEGSLSVACDWVYETKAFSVQAEQVKDGKALACDAGGSFADVVPGQSIKVDLDSLSVIKEGEQFCELSGSYFLEPLNVEVMVPQESIDIGKYLK